MDQMFGSDTRSREMMILPVRRMCRWPNFGWLPDQDHAKIELLTFRGVLGIITCCDSDSFEDVIGFNRRGEVDWYDAVLDS